MNDKLGSDLAYNNPSSFVAELFANFGYFSPVFWGFVFSYILFATIVAIRIVPSGFKSVYLVFLTFYFSKFSAKEFMPTIFDYKLLTLIIVSVVFFWVFQRYFSRVS
jgi:hypothetical protein